jgi:hypothetical protein
MPEGHTLHRLARLHQKRFANAPVVVTSPQGRGAAAEVVCGFSSLMPLPVFTSAARWSSDGVRARPQRCILRRVGLASLGPEAYAGIWTPLRAAVGEIDCRSENIAMITKVRFSVT